VTDPPRLLLPTYGVPGEQRDPDLVHGCVWVITGLGDVRRFMCFCLGIPWLKVRTHSQFLEWLSSASAKPICLEDDRTGRKRMGLFVCHFSL
jgi:hypothetical protein